jgi:hypothetical protein
MTSFAQLLGLLGLLSGGLPQIADAPPASGEIELRLELRQGKNWQPVDIHTVFHNRDAIRFTFKSSFAGYLRVINKSSDGETTAIFPVGDQALPTQVQANTDYLIPGAKGSYLVGGKAGFDLTQWVISAVPLKKDWQPTDFSTETDSLLPRCQDEALDARKPCLDKRAGPASAVSPKDESSTTDTPLIARDLSFRDKGMAAQISIPDISKTMVVYEFRVAHR